MHHKRKKDFLQNSRNNISEHKRYGIISMSVPLLGSSYFLALQQMLGDRLVRILDIERYSVATFFSFAGKHSKNKSF